MEELRNFAQMWRTEHAMDPGSFPMSMGEGDWFEQFLTEQTRG